jgi:hypothetical protein|tara:strand:+ start:72 stop:839 length:768 start_codon:yes stop_codon:yes gene_type:complete
MANYEFPTEVIELPSQGKAYPEGHPLSKGTVELKYMTAKEEDILASQNLIRKGVVLDKLFESVVVEDGLDINDIFVGDKNAILLATRVLGYGADYEVEITDPSTLEPQKVIIDLSKVQTKDIDFDKLNSMNSYEFELPTLKKTIKFKLLTHKDEVDINKDIQAMQRLSGKGDVPSQDVSTRLRYMIQEVDGNTERGFINNFVKNNLLARDSRALRNHVREISPDLDLTFQFTSDITGDTEALDIPFGTGFFYPSE